MKLYKYHGQIAGESCRSKTEKEITLYDPKNGDKPPTRLHVGGGLETYLDGIRGSDLEEKYMETDYFYDELLYLRRIEIPSSNPRIPAKIIAQIRPYDEEVVIFGPREYIAREYPAPMDEGEWKRWLDWKGDNLDSGGAACNDRIKVIHIAGVAEQFKRPKADETPLQEYARQRDNVLSVWERLYKWITRPGNWDAYVRVNEVCAVLELALDLKEEEI